MKNNWNESYVYNLWQDPETICILLNVCPKPQDLREETKTTEIDTKKASEEQVVLGWRANASVFFHMLVENRIQLLKNKYLFYNVTF